MSFSETAQIIKRAILLSAATVSLSLCAEPVRIVKMRTHPGFSSVNNGVVTVRVEKERAVPTGAGYSLSIPADNGFIMRLSGERRAEKISIPRKSYLGDKVQVLIQTDKQTFYPGLFPRWNSYDWERFEFDFYIPEDAKKGHLFCGLQGSTGLFQVRDLLLRKVAFALDIGTQANRGYRDAKEGDGKGGWSDQGPQNDGGCFIPQLKKLKFGGVPMRAFPEKGVLAMESKSSPNGLKSAQFHVGENFTPKMLYVLHTLCWRKAGEHLGNFEIEYANGKKQTIPVQSGRDVGDWWNASLLPNGTSGVFVRSVGETRGLYLSRFALTQTSPVKRVRITSTNPTSLWLIAAVSLTGEEIPLQQPVPKKRLTVTASADWKPFELEDYNRRNRNSLLDLSRLMPRKPAGVEGRVIVRPDGHFAFSDTPDQIQRFFSCILNLKDTDSRWKVQWLVNEIVKNGYNAVRFHGLDSYLMRGARKTAEFNTDHLDLFDYCISELKKNGIYVIGDMMTSQVAGYAPYGRHFYGGVETPKGNIRKRLMIHFDPAIRAEWKAGVEALLCHKNPYTGLRLIDDPVLAMTLGYNEQEFEFDRSYFRPELVAPYYRNFLQKKYGSMEVYNRKWKTNYRTFEEIPPFRNRRSGNSDVREFLFETERATAQWYVNTLRELGYKGLVTAYNLEKSHFFNRIRQETCDYVSINSYHSHPSNGSYENDSTMIQESSMSRGASLFRDIISAKLNGKPLTVTEYACVYWNKYRFEQPYVAGAYAAFQGVDLLNCFSDTVSISPSIFKDSYMHPFRSVEDPIAMASEFQTFFLFRRGDIKPAPNRIQIVVGEETFQSKSAFGVISKEQSVLALLDGFSLVYNGKPDASAIRFSNIGFSESAGSDAFLQTIDVAVDSRAYIKYLREKGILSRKNHSNGINIFETSTEEIYLDTDKNFMRINTPRFQGICAEAGTRCELPDFTIDSMSVRGNISLIAVDALKPIRKARKMMLIIATNALTENVCFDDLDMTHMIRHGKGRGLLQTGKFTVTIRNDHAEKLILHPLNLAGRRMGKLSPKIQNGRAVFTLDTAKDGATVFFEITTL